MAMSLNASVNLRAVVRSLAGNRYQADDLKQGAILRAIDAARLLPSHA